MENHQLPYTTQPPATGASGAPVPGVPAAAGATPPPAPAAAGPAAGVLGVPAAGGGARVGVRLQEPPAAAGTDQEDREGRRGRAYDLRGGACALRQGVRALHPRAHHPPWLHAEENKRRTLQRNDVAAAIARTDVFDFLVDIVPREEAKEEPGSAALGFVAGGWCGRWGPAAGLPYYYPPMGQLAAPMMPAWHVPAWEPAWQQGGRTWIKVPELRRGRARVHGGHGSAGFSGASKLRVIAARAARIDTQMLFTTPRNVIV
ncbi:hypothetical protein ZWY2020_060052 [Hordeum vulgare]|nr:hypothetical protein ZWY2020_060052 [Hordeum vulgare]